MATTIDDVRRACIRIGTGLMKDDTATRAQIADLQTRADATVPTDTLAISNLAKELAAFGA
jgi:hypothetical protein